MESKKRHIVIVPFPAQGHINPMLKIAMLLHSKGFYITFIHSSFNYDRLVTSVGENHPLLQGGLERFRFETIPDGLPSDNKRGVHDLHLFATSLYKEPKTAFKPLLTRLSNPVDDEVPPLSCVLSDAHMNFVFDVGNELGIRVLLFYTQSACALQGFLHYDELITRGLVPLKDDDCLTNGYLDTQVDWIPGLTKGATLKHLPTFLRTSNPNDVMFKYNYKSTENMKLSNRIIVNTFDDLETKVLNAIKTKMPNICTIGPLPLLTKHAEVQTFGTSLWKEDTNCLTWLDKKPPKSVIYVNYGSLTTLTAAELEEFAWGLANSKQNFLWVIRNDLLLNGESENLSEEFMEAIKETGLISGWSDQDRVLKHPAVRVFLTHCGWNSTMESICEGIPMICWPFFADQPMNCFYACDGWGVGTEIGTGEVKRARVEEVVREMMVGEKGRFMKEKTMEWKKKGEDATRVGGSSYDNFEKLVGWLVDKN